MKRISSYAIVFVCVAFITLATSVSAVTTIPSPTPPAPAPTSTSTPAPPGPVGGAVPTPAPPGPAGGAVPNPSKPGGGAVPGSPAPTGLSYALKNPLAFDSLEALIVAILKVLIVLATPIVVFFIIFAGFSYVTARGNPAKIQQANQSLLYAVIGGVLIIGAVAIAEIIKNLIGSFSA